MRSWLPLWFVVGACYRPIDMAHCAITCDPLVSNCPGGLVCGTDSFCHSLDEQINGCLSGLIDAAPRPDAFLVPKDGPPDAPVLAIDAPACSAEWRASFGSDPTAGTGLRWLSAGAVPFDYATQVSSGVWSAPDMTGLETTPGFEFQHETIVTADLDLPQVGEAAAFTIGLTDATQFAQLSLAIAHPTAGTETLVLTNNDGAAQPEMLLSTTASLGSHHLRLDLVWTTGTARLTVDGGAASQATFTMGTGGTIPTTVAVRVTSGAKFDDLDVCVP